MIGSGLSPPLYTHLNSKISPMCVSSSLKGWKHMLALFRSTQKSHCDIRCATYGVVCGDPSSRQSGFCKFQVFEHFKHTRGGLYGKDSAWNASATARCRFASPNDKPRGEEIVKHLSISISFNYPYPDSSTSIFPPVHFYQFNLSRENSMFMSHWHNCFVDAKRRIVIRPLPALFASPWPLADTSTCKGDIITKKRATRNTQRYKNHMQTMMMGAETGSDAYQM